jgi:hypothetical protein
MTTQCEIAHRLRTLGLSVIPIPIARAGVPPGRPGDGKVPGIAWKDYQTRLPTAHEIDHWFDGAPMNLAIVTGAISGVVVVDADDLPALRWATKHLTYTPWQTQTSKGFHLYFRHPGVPVPNRARLNTADGKLQLDVRGDGGYVIAPGSVHASGATYTFAGDWTEPRDRVPFFWLGLLARPNVVKTSLQTSLQHAAKTHAHTGKTSSHAAVITRARAYLAAIPPPTIGGGSDAATLYAACKLVRGFALSASEAETLLWDWCGNRSGWTRDWVAEKIQHAERYGTEPIGALR